MAILQTDVLDYAKEQRLYPGIESSLTYITKLHNEELHLLARPEIKDISGLANQKVNVDLRGSGTSITSSRLFDLLKLTVTMVNDSQDVALDKLRRGEIAALAFVAGKPAPLFLPLKANDGLHFLAVPINAATTNIYIPAYLSTTDYPVLGSGLITIGQRAQDELGTLGYADLWQNRHLVAERGVCVD